MTIEGPQSEPDITSQNPYKQILKKAGREHRLMSVHWELTYRCNERCSHCYLDVMNPNAPVHGELTTEECCSIIDQISESGALNLTLSGGEIFVRRDWYEIASYAHSKRLLLRLFTNGIMIKPQIADKIAGLHPYAVEVSLYSTKPEVHDGITGIRHSWELTTRAIRLLRERGVRVMMKTPLMRENVAELDEIKTFASQLDAGFKFDITVTPKNDGGLQPLRHQMTYSQLVWLMKKTMHARTWLDREIKPNQGTCGIGSLGIVIDPEGNVYPCIEARISSGNLRTQSLREIWERKDFWEELNQINLDILPVCRTCELVKFCTRCHGLAKVETGDLYGPSPSLCREALARRQVLVELGELPQDFPVPEHLVQYLDDLNKSQEITNVIANEKLMFFDELSIIGD